MKRKSLKRKLFKSCFILIFLMGILLLTSCAMFNHRYTSWNESVSRNADGVLSFAETSTQGNGTSALLLIHGFGDGPHVWNTLAPALAEKGFTVRTMLIPGWCEPIEVKRSVTLTDWHQRIQNELRDLRETHEHVTILAHSMGACIATVLVQAGEIEPDALVLYAPMFGVSNIRSPLLKTETWFKIGARILPDSMILESMFPDHARVSEPRPKTERDPFVPVSVYKMVYAEMHRFDEQPPAVSCPVRLVLPGEDHVVDTEKASIWFDHLNAPDKIRTILKKTGHVVPLDLDAEMEADRLSQWLSKQGIAP